MMRVARSNTQRLRDALVAISLLVGYGVGIATTAVAAPTLRAQIAASISAGDAQQYVKVVSVIRGPGESQTISSMAGPDIGIQNLTAGGSDHMAVEYVKKTLYVKAALGFLEGTFGLSNTVATPYINKWAVVAPNNPSYQTVFLAVTIKSLMSFLAGAGPVTSGTAKVVAGIKVKALHVAIPKSQSSPAGTETLYIASAGPPLTAETVFLGSGYSSTMKFSRWGKPFTLQAPITSLLMPSAQSG